MRDGYEIQYKKPEENDSYHVNNEDAINHKEVVFNWTKSALEIYK